MFVIVMEGDITKEKSKFQNPYSETIPLQTWYAQDVSKIQHSLYMYIVCGAHLTVYTYTAKKLLYFIGADVRRNMHTTMTMKKKTVVG